MNLNTSFYFINYMDEKIWKCNFCKREFKSKKALFAHLRFCPERPINIRKKQMEECKKREEERQKHKEQDLYLGEEYY